MRKSSRVAKKGKPPYNIAILYFRYYYTSVTLSGRMKREPLTRVVLPQGFSLGAYGRVTKQYVEMRKYTRNAYTWRKKLPIQERGYNLKKDSSLNFISPRFDERFPLCLEQIDDNSLDEVEVLSQVLKTRKVFET